MAQQTGAHQEISLKEALFTRLGKVSTYVVGGACAVLLASCSDVTNTPGYGQIGDDTYGYVAVDEDPLEGFNRSAFKTHTIVDQIIVRPVSIVYNSVVPETGRSIVSNFLENLSAPVDFVNSVLQGDVENSFATFWTFMINSTFGIAGAFDVAEEAGLEARETSFGDTLASVGVGSGPFIFLPVIGPTTVRDGVGRGIDILFRPVTWINGDTWSFVEAGANGLDFRANNMKVLDGLYNNSIDPYAAYRSAYLQRRAAQLDTAKDGWWRLTDE